MRACAIASRLARPLRAVGLGWWLIAGGPAWAQDSALEYAVKATYLYKFAPFVTWPASVFPSPTSPLDICVLGDDAFAKLVGDAVAGQSLAAHPFVVQRLQAASEAGSCQILFVAGGDPSVLGATLRALRGKPILTVTDAAGNEPRGIINFVVADARVRFEINLAEATRDQLTISSKLLSLALSVQAASTPEDP